MECKNSLSSSKQLNLTSNSTIQDYFPYGKVLRKYVTGDEERYLTTQHERDEETGLDYRGARYYDSVIARFLSLDPLAKEYPSHSDYCYVAGNPTMFIDPTGKAVEYSKEVAEAMAKRGASNGYTTEVVENPDKAGDYGVSFTKSTGGKVYHKTQFEGKFTGIGKAGLVKDPELLPELTPEQNTGVLLTQAMFQGAAEGTAETTFKYAEKGIPKNGHVPGEKLISKTIGNAATIVTVSDKAAKTLNGIIEKDYDKAASNFTAGVGYTAAAVMMATPTGVTQIAGACLFIGVAIYDLFTNE